MFQLVEPFQGSFFSGEPLPRVARLRRLPTLGYDVQPLRGIHFRTSLLVGPNLELLKMSFEIAMQAKISVY